MTEITTFETEVDRRALLSMGSSNDSIYRAAVRALATRNISGGLVIDVGCGSGNLWKYIEGRFSGYIGVDTVRYRDFPSVAEFVRTDLNKLIPLPAGIADVVISVETIEHLENPRAFIRELVRLAKPDGWVIVTTPNQLSLLSLCSLLLKKRFGAFQDVHYPAHLTALLEIDLRRIAAECRLAEIDVEYTQSGRIPFTAWHYPAWLSRWLPRECSDNLLLAAHKV